MSAVLHGGGRRSAADNRAFNYAIIASLLLHGALLFTASLQRESRGRDAPLGPITARLVIPQAAPAQPQPQAPQAEPSQPRVEEPIPPVPKAAPKAAPVAKPSPVPAPKAAPQAQPQPAQPQPQPAAPSPSQAAPAQAPSAPSASPSLAKTDPQPGAAAPDAGVLDAYRTQLMEMAKKYKRYPRVALDNNWEGRVVVRLVIGANGMISSLSVTSSAGHEVLDKQALDMIQKAKGAVPVPAAMRGKESVLEIPVIYNMKDQNAG